MKIKLSFKTLKYIALAFIFIFIYGIFVIEYNFFPYKQLSNIKSQTNIYLLGFSKEIEEEKNLFSKFIKDIPWTEKIEKNTINYIPDGILNSFEVYKDDSSSFTFDRSKIILSAIEGSSIKRYSDKSYEILKGSPISKVYFENAIKKNGGIKTFLEFDGNLIILVPLVDYEKNCDFASLINLTLNKIIYNFDCLPDSLNVDFNGLGGGYVVDDKNKVLLLALGAPESYSEQIRNLSQNHLSPYGKILEISLAALKGNGEKWKIFSSGNRAILAMTQNGKNIIAVENGPRGGDEINFIERQSNYGWPLISVGDSYDLKKINKVEEEKKSVFKLPAYSFIPSIAPSTISTCPEIYAQHYQPFSCYLMGSLRGESLYFVLFKKGSEKIVSIESYRIRERIRKLEVISKNEFVVFADSGKIIFFNLKEMKNFDLLKLRDKNL